MTIIQKESLNMQPRQLPIPSKNKFAIAFNPLSAHPPRLMRGSKMKNPNMRSTNSITIKNHLFFWKNATLTHVLYLKKWHPKTFILQD